MASTITLDTPLADSLKNSVHIKAIEQGWTQEDDPSLAEYIVLMLANGKNQDQIASELAGDLLQDASGTDEFAQWLFEQVTTLTGGNTGAATEQSVAATGAPQDDAAMPAAYEMDVGDSAPDNAPRGPKGLHGGRGDRGRGRGDRRDALHRTRGNDRINSHMRGTPRGPKNGHNASVKPGMQKALNGMLGQGQNQMMQNGQGGMMPNMTPQDFMAMMEQQSRMMAQFNAAMMQNMNGGNFPTGQGRSLFDRVETGRGRGGRGRGRGGVAQNGNHNAAIDDTAGEVKQNGDNEAQMEVDNAAQGSDPSSTLCFFNLRCSNTSCPYAHQSTAAPQGVAVDLSKTCQFASACKDANCNGKHPSPANKRAFQNQEMCKFFPHCTNPNCAFKHPTMPMCRFGASCKNKDCQFTHLQTKCRYNPCTNANCPYQHEDGQARTFDSYTWTPDKAKQGESETGADTGHVSDRKFVDDNAGEEELVKPQAGGESEADVAPAAAVIS